MQQPVRANAGLVLDDSVSHQRWNDPQYPFKPLDRPHALHYFEFSPFFDQNSNNRQARMLGRDPANDAELKAMPMDTTEFALAETHEPHLFVVRKQQRQSAVAGKAAISAYYYILGYEGHTYQAPSLHAAITARLRRAMHHIRSGFNTFKSDLAPLPKVLREALKEQEDIQKQQLEKLAAMDTDVDLVAPAAAGAEAAVSAAGASAGAASAAAAAVAVPEVVSEQEQEQWAKTDNIIMHVLKRYPLPRLPKSKEEEERERQEQLAREQMQAQRRQQHQQQQQLSPPAQQQQSLPSQTQQLQPAVEGPAVSPPPTLATASEDDKQKGQLIAVMAGAAIAAASPAFEPTPLQTTANAGTAPASSTGSRGSKGTKRARGMTPPIRAAAAPAATTPGGMAPPAMAAAGPVSAAARPTSSANSQGSAGGPSKSHAGPTMSASIGGGMSASIGGTAATAGSKLRLKFKLGKKLPGQQEPQVEEDPAAKRLRQ